MRSVDREQACLRAVAELTKRRPALGYAQVPNRYLQGCHRVSYHLATAYGSQGEGQRR